MTVGGTGDVLAGITAALLAKSKDPFRAACAAAFISGVSGDLLYEKVGPHLTASGVADEIPKAINSCIR